MPIIPGAEPFYFAGNHTGCLLIHGFTGTPNEMRWLGTQLALAGHTVVGVRLAGHGTSPEEMNTTRWRDWYADVEDGYCRLRAECDRVFLIGLSLGGVLALHLAAHEQPDGVVAMAAPVHIRDWRLTVFRPLQRFIPYWRKAGGKPPAGASLPVLDKAMHRANLDYDRMPTACIVSMLDFFRIVEKELPAIHVPTRLIYAPQDRLAPRDEAQFIYDRISSKDKRMLSLDRSGHIVCDDVERVSVLDEVIGFLGNRAAIGSQVNSEVTGEMSAQHQLQSSGFPTAFH
jgi:carboxylesterase